MSEKREVTPHQVGVEDAIRADFQKCYGLATRMASMDPTAPGVWTGTVSERLVLMFEALHSRAEAADAALSKMEQNLEGAEAKWLAAEARVTALVAHCRRRHGCDMAEDLDDGF